MLFCGIPLVRASDAAYEAIKKWIQTAQVPAGGLIDELDAAKKLSMSRTPVREALLRLQSEGFVEIGRGKGIRVLPLSTTDMRHIYQVITGLEVVAVSLLARRRPPRKELRSLIETTAEMKDALATGDVDRWGEADERFHRELMRLSGNPKLHSVGSHLRDLAKRAHMVAVRLQSDAYRAKSTKSHTALIETMLTGDADEAAAGHLQQRQRGEDALVGIVEKFSLGSL
jgi:DNA-binding GntR family transcriptional regulator